MTAVIIAGPTADNAKRYPREFALLAQLPTSADGSVSVEELQALVKTYGSGGTVPAEGTVPFNVVGELLRKPGAALSDANNCLGIAAHDTSGHLQPWEFRRRECGADDVRVQVTHCGMCHSDLHQIKNEWSNATYPMVPGHEIVGVVTEVGSGVSGFKVGAKVGVGCMVRSCGSCGACEDKEEEFCPKCVFTYNSPDWADGSTTYGGYSSHMVVDKKFVLRIPDNLPLDATAPLLCAGITTYTPLVHFGINKPGMRLGVVGLGGLGHMAVKFGKAMGMKVVVFSTSPSKQKEAIDVLGADEFVVSKDADAMSKVANSLHGIIDTVSAAHDLHPYLSALKYDGKLVLVGLPTEALPVSPMALVFKRATVAGSLIGGIERTQEMLDFCGKHNITCEIENISADYVNTAMERLVKNDVRYRFVIDVQNSIVVGA